MTSVAFVDLPCDICGSDESTELMSMYGTAYHECRQCGLIYLRPMIDNTAELNEVFYTRAIDKYVAKIKSKRKKNHRKLRQFAGFKKTGRFLEIGCNTGAVISVANDMGWEAKGVDLSETASKFAREQMKLDVFTGTVEEAGYPDDFFDVIYTNATLEHIKHPLSLLQECLRILRPGGVFYADTVNWDSYTRRVLGEGWRLLDPRDHVHLFTPDNVQSLSRYSGFEHLKTWTTGFRAEPNASEAQRNHKVAFYWRWLKGPISLLTRFTKKGDSIEFLLQKPEGD